MERDFETKLYDRKQIAERVKEMGAEITRDYAGKELILACILRGAFIFCADLARAIDLPVRIEFLEASSYGEGAQSTGNVKIKKDFDLDISGKHVMLVEDIVDTGLTLDRLKAMLLLRKPASLAICAFLDKAERRVTSIQADYVGFCIPDAFVVGYGLDYAQSYRHIPDLQILKPEIYEK